MDRRQFLKIASISSALASAGKLEELLLDVGGDFAFADSHTQRLSASELELIGKRKPRLVGFWKPLRKKASEAFKDLAAAAKREGIDIALTSAYRDFDKQINVWNNSMQHRLTRNTGKYCSFSETVRYVALPGTSRHHFGTDIDVLDASKILPKGFELVSEDFATGGLFEKLSVWLENNSEKYGFIQPYTADPNRSGFGYEPWHLSFAELSIPIFQEYVKIPMDYIPKEKLKGGEFLSDAFLANYREEFVFGLNKKLI